MSKVKRTERGWAGHFIGGPNCMYHRNTLLEFEGKQVIVSTVGAYRPDRGELIQTIGHHRYYETMAFGAKEESGYIEIDVTEEIVFNSEWGIWAESVEDLPPTVDMDADKMHERVVAEISKDLQGGRIK